MCSPLGFEHLCQYTQTLSIYADAADDKNGADADVNDICNNTCQSAPTCPQYVCQRKRLESNGKVYFQF